MIFESQGYNLNVTKVQLIGTDKNYSANFIYIGNCSIAEYLSASEKYDSLINHFKEFIANKEEEVVTDDESWEEYYSQD